jgi:hypothetical protein
MMESVHQDSSSRLNIGARIFLHLLQDLTSVILSGRRCAHRQRDISGEFVNPEEFVMSAYMYVSIYV